MTRLALMMSALLVLAACETTKGFGEDVEDLGQTIQEEAE